MKNEAGNRYGKLTVLSFHHINKSKNAYWLCACDCGLTTVVCGSYLRSGHTTSCGCIKREFFGEKHGRSDKERLYGVWQQMRSRCNNPNNPRYKTYGEKGVSVCEEWNDYGKFRAWSYQNGYSESAPGTPKKDVLSIDRIDPNEGYSPENCRWVTISENSKHRFECHANQR